MLFMPESTQVTPLWSQSQRKASSAAVRPFGSPAMSCFARRQQIHQLAAPQGLHDDHRDASGRGGLQTGPAGLADLVHVVVLDLTEVPVIGLQDLQKHLRVSVEGEADLADGAGLLFPGDPVLDPQGHQLVPGVQIREHVH